MAGGTGTGTGTGLWDLPHAVAGLVLGRVQDPLDLASAASACRYLRDAAPAAPCRLRLRPPQAAPQQQWTWAVLAWLRRRLPHTLALDLAGCPIFDQDVADVLRDLPCLDCLLLDNCQKLTSAVADKLADCVSSGPRSVSLQRCYRLGPTAAGNLLVAASGHGSRLECILLSHLDGLNFPARSQQQQHLGAGLRILALHNCSTLGPHDLSAVAGAAPCLEMLMLGGSMHGLGLAKSDDLLPDKVALVSAVLAATIEALPRLQVLEITFFSALVAQAVRDQVRKGVFIWDFCDPTSVAKAAAVLTRFKISGGLMSNAVQRRDTHFTACTEGRGDENNTSVLENGILQQTEEDVALALQAAANCSDTRRRTPLHIAALCGNCDMMRNLLFIGASASGKKDLGGATALFWAAEYGHAEACHILLRAGAELFERNRGGEAPLYIAALKGHAAAVEAIVEHCREHGVIWQDARLYCDGWTPLLAAAVVGHQEVGRILLSAKGDEKLACCLLDAQNRYGLTALHISARKPSVWFVETLLDAGASLDIRDNSGHTALDLALQFGHQDAAQILRQRKAFLEPATSPSPSGANNPKRRLSRKKQTGRHGEVGGAVRWVPKAVVLPLPPQGRESRDAASAPGTRAADETQAVNRCRGGMGPDSQTSAAV